jgi:uncharacterized protein
VSAEKPIRIGLISDTHGLLRDEAVAALKGCRHILHAGDIDTPDVLEKLRRLAPVTAVRGNNDRGPWAKSIPVFEVVEFGAVSVYVRHDESELDIDPVAAGELVIAGDRVDARIIELGVTSG